MLRAEVQLVLRRLFRRGGAAAGGELPDGALLEQFTHSHDEAAFAALVERHGPLVLGVCRRVLGHRQDAEDAFQATFLILARRAAGLRRDGSLAPWLHTVAYRLALRAHADAARRPAGGARDLDMLSAKPEAAAAWQDVQPVLDEELQRLPEKYRAPVVLCYLEGQTHAEAARQLGWPKGTVAGRLARARELLRARLERRGVTLSAGVLAAVLAEHAHAAPVPAVLKHVATRGAIAFATASTAAGVSPAVVALALGGLQAMFAAKVKAGVLVAAAFLVAGGAGVWAHQALREPPAPEEPLAQETAAGAQAAAERPQVRLDLYGDPLPPGAIARMGTVRFRDYGNPHTVTYSDGDTKIVSTYRSPIVCVWDAATGQMLHCFHGFTDRHLAFTVSPDQRIVAAATPQGAIELWDLATQKKTRSWHAPNANAPKEHQRRTDRLAFSPTGRLLAAAGGDGFVRLWKAATGELLQAWPVDLEGWSLPISPEDRLIAFAGRDRVLRVCETATGKERWTTTVDEWVPSACFSPDGKALVAAVTNERTSTGQAMYVWEAATGRELRRLGTEHQIGFLALSPDGKTMATVVFAIGGSVIRLWDVPAGRELREFKLPMAGGLAFSSDGKKLVTADGRIRQWDVATGTELIPQRGHESPVGAVALVPDGRLAVTADLHGNHILWDAFTGKELRRQNREMGERRGFAPLAFSADGRLLVTSGTHPGASVWNTATRQEVRRITLGEKQDVHKLALSPDGKLLALSIMTRRPHSEVGLWDLATGKHLRSLEAEKGGSFLGVTFAADGRTVFALRAPHPVGESEVYAWDVASGKGSPRFGVGTSSSTVGPAEAAFSPDGRWFVRTHFAPEVSRKEQILRLWDTATGKETRVISRPESVLSSPVFSPDGRVLAAQSHDGDVVLWEVATGRERRSFPGHRRGGSVQASAVAFSADGTLLASASGEGIGYLWDVGGRLNPAKGPLSVKELETHWAALLGDDAVQAEQAIRALAAHPNESLPMLTARLRPAATPDPASVARLIGDLDNARFTVREQAAADLEKLGEPILPALREALAAKPTTEARRRLETVREQVAKTALTPAGERLRETRALEILERIGPSARGVIESLAKGLPEVTMTREAKASLQRLARRPATSP